MKFSKTLVVRGRVSAIPAEAALASLLLLVGCTEPSDSERDGLAIGEAPLVNGALQPDDAYPWVVNLTYGTLHCHGALISPGWVLTAAHCFDANFDGVINSNDGPNGQGSLSATRVGPSGTESQTAVFNGWGAPTPDVYLQSWVGSKDDLALIRLNTVLAVQGDVRPVTLASTPPVDQEIGALATTQTVSGIPTPAGTMAVGSYRLSLPCNRQTELCTKPVGGDSQQTVAGDSGSGLVNVAVADPELIGILSSEAHGDGLTTQTWWTNLVSGGAYYEWMMSNMRLRRFPDTSIVYPVTACRTAPPRVNGNGPRRRADLAEVFPDNFPAHYTSIAQHPSTGFSFNVFEEWMRTAGGASADIRWSAGDFDNDGDQDLMAVWKDGNNNHMTLWRSTGGSFVPVEWGAPPAMGGWSSTAQWIPGDFNGDGWADLVSAWNNNGSTALALFLGNGSAFTGFTQDLGGDGPWDDRTKFVTGDFNGDGHDDIVSVERTPYGNGQFGTKLFLRKSDFSNVYGRWTLYAKAMWMDTHGGWDDTTVWLGGNFTTTPSNELPKSDVMAIWRNGTTTNNTAFTMYPTNSTGSGVAPLWYLTLGDGTWATTHKWSVGDVDADGYDDIIAAWNHGGTPQMTSLTVRRVTGTGLGAQQAWATDRVVWQPATIWCAGTFDAN